MNKFLKPLALGVVLVSVMVYFAWPGTPAGVPEGYLYQASKNHDGGMLIARVSGQSATRLLVDGIKSMDGFFDAAPIPASGISDQKDQVAQVIFHATKDGENVAGVGLATVSGNEGFVRIDYGPPQSLTHMLSDLTNGGTVQTSSKSADTPAMNWRQVPYPDGSGQVSLPQGWQITFSHKGHVIALGPQGMLDKGLELSLMTRASAMALANFGVPVMSNQMIGDPVDPVTAMADATQQMSALSGNQWRITNVREVAPYAVEYPLAQAAFIDNDQIDNGQQYRCLSNIILTTVISSGHWTYFQSRVCSSPDTFAENLPVLMQIWKSAVTSPQEIQSRWDNALANMREVGEILAAGQTSRSVGMERAQAPMIESLQGRRIIEEIATGQQANAELAYSSEIVNALNAQRGYQAYREIPRSEWVSR